MLNVEDIKNKIVCSFAPISIIANLLISSNVHAVMFYIYYIIVWYVMELLKGL